MNRCRQMNQCDRRTGINKKVLESLASILAFRSVAGFAARHNRWLGAKWRGRRGVKELWPDTEGHRTSAAEHRKSRRQGQRRVCWYNQLLQIELRLLVWLIIAFSHAKKNNLLSLLPSLVFPQLHREKNKKITHFKDQPIQKHLFIYIVFIFLPFLLPLFSLLLLCPYSLSLLS